MLNKCETVLSRCTRHNEDMREAIISFDQVLSGKADRHSLLEVRKWATESFLPLKFSETQADKDKAIRGDLCALDLRT